MPCWNIIARCITGLSLAMPVMLVAQGDQGNGSPYSAYGLGEFVGSTQVSQALMGGLGAAVVDPFSLVNANPASYVSLQRTCFETGMVVRPTRYKTASEEAFGRRVGLLGLSMGVPFGKGRWGIGIGVAPVSEVDYNITDAQQLADGTDVTYSYVGDGGLNQSFIGLGWTVREERDSLNNGYRLSVGANLSYLFGRVEETRKAIYPGNSGLYNTSVVSNLVLRDPTGNLGVHFQGDLRRKVSRSDEGLQFLAGVAVELPTNLGAKQDQLVTNFALSSRGVEQTYDTVSYSQGRPGNFALPIGLRAGFTVYNLRWTLSGEVVMRNWQDLRVSTEGYTLPNKLANSSTYILGASYRPAGEIGGSFWERTIYRAGIRYYNDYLVVNGTQLQEIGMSFGVSLPLMGSTTRSRFNLGTELGQRGTTANGLIQEHYATVYLGVTITPDIREQWFKKRRIE
jgi:hypothetical protein